MDTKEKLAELKELIQKANYIVFFGGAGVSTESGLPDFRSVDGLYHQKYAFPPEEILSHDFGNPSEFCPLCLAKIRRAREAKGNYYPKY